MAARLPDGATVAIATTYGAAVDVTAVSNANPAVASAVGHGFTNGDLIVVKSGWQRINDRIVRASGVTADAFALEGMDTLNTQQFPAGSGGGSVQEIGVWTEIAQILEFTTTGGDQQFVNFSYLADNFERQLPTVTSAQSITIGIADDITLPGFLALKAVSDTRSVTALKLTLPDGSLILYNGIFALNETPSLNKGQVMQVTATMSLQSRPVRYSA